MAKLKDYNKTEKHRRRDKSKYKTFILNHADKWITKMQERKYRAQNKMLVKKIMKGEDVDDQFDNTHRTMRNSALYDSW